MSFKKYASNKSRSQAENIADEKRWHGYNARIRKDSKGFSVYIEKKVGK